MCDTLITVDGIELTTVGEARRYGVAIPDRFFSTHSGADRCLCGVGLDALLAGHAAAWQEGVFWAGSGYAELDADGRTWFDGFDLQTRHPHLDIVEIERSDGRRELTLEAWEAAHATRAAGSR